MVGISLDKQIHIYSVDTSSFYSNYELKTHKILNKYYIHRNELNIEKNKVSKKMKKNYNEQFQLELNKINQSIRIINKRIKYNKQILKDKFYTFQLRNDKKIKNRRKRTLREEHINDKNIISVFDSTLTRVLDLEIDSISKDIMVIQMYFFDVMRDLIFDGYLYNDEEYIFFSASAGQIRTKKAVFIKKSSFKKHKATIMCGLSLDKINKIGGVNINKYLAYLALCNSATDEWKEFDISKSIVVEDFETLVTGEVDFINNETYEIKRSEMEVPIPHTDGCGMILPSKSKNNFMIRLPWVKGLLVSFPFDKFIREQRRNGNKKCGKIKDIYDKEYDILEDDIEIIFTKSQFKMWKYYKSWEEYKNNYKKFNCQAGMCNVEEDEFTNAKLNYQMLQTLTSMTDEELMIIASKTNNDILNISKDMKTMLKVFGVVKANNNKTNLQQALEIYPEMLLDNYTKSVLGEIKKSMVKEAKSGKVEIDGNYTFISPDLYAFCEWLFLGEENPKGLLKKNEVYCDLYKNNEELDCLRSPHLYREHPIRLNTIDNEKKRWFGTHALYTSCHDLISRILQNDVDGDKSLVCAESKVIEVAKRDMQNIAPLYYDMPKAGVVEINKDTVYNGLIAAFTGGNIGEISNTISKIWNDEDVNLEAIKLQCMKNNFIID